MWRRAWGGGKLGECGGRGGGQQGTPFEVHGGSRELTYHRRWVGARDGGWGVFVM